MKKLAVTILALALAGCASMPQPMKRPQQKVVHEASKAKPAPASSVAAPVPTPAPIATKLTKPSWYDRFRSRFFKKKEG